MVLLVHGNMQLALLKCNNLHLAQLHQCSLDLFTLNRNRQHLVSLKISSLHLTHLVHGNQVTVLLKCNNLGMVHLIRLRLWEVHLSHHSNSLALLMVYLGIAKWGISMIDLDLLRVSQNLAFVHNNQGARLVLKGNGIMFTHEQPNVVASQGQPVAGKFESESRSGGSYGQPRNGHSHHQTGSKGHCSSIKEAYSFWSSVRKISFRKKTESVSRIVNWPDGNCEPEDTEMSEPPIEVPSATGQRFHSLNEERNLRQNRKTPQEPEFKDQLKAFDYAEARKNVSFGEPKAARRKDDTCQGN
ncbi:hypothetical protein PR202_gb27083 [Eleusine coracana subsp. coracana]|uniref:Uncharacterized protein n=1 Tax=Eleusine coracana subsp. coracana TaxID=191504 RepID=A0AAV5FTB0_ELECO|nr:hypothetical protein PR202_gb27083 [Eleusine coracana subsp. coracana]